MTLNTPRALFLLVIFFFAAWDQALAGQSYPENLYQDMHWRLVGPFRGGRTRAVAGVPSQPNVFYVGAVNGGVWKSDDYGRTWNPIFERQTTQSIGAIAVAPGSPDVIYVASGEGLQRPDLSVGDGIYKSTDGGSTWNHLGLQDGQQIPALAIDPRNPDRIFAAVLGHPYGPNPQRGIFRSQDGGQTWEKVLYKDENTGASDVEIDPSHPEVVYAGLWQSRLGPSEDNNSFAGTSGGLFKSVDGGSTWKKIGKGLPEDLVQINVAISPSESRRLYATISTTKPAKYASDEGLGFYRSDDAGENWYRVTTDPRPAMKIGGGDLAIPRIDPKNPDIVYSASIVTVRSEDGGKTWQSIRGAPGGDDYQNLWINPDNPDIILLVSDQGAVVSTNRGRTWSSWYNQPTAQLFHVITTNSYPYKICGAQQESGSVCINSRGNDGEITFRDWHPVGVIEYGYVAPDPLDPDIIYGAGRNEVSRFHWSTGQVENVTPIPIRDDYRVTRTEPLIFSPIDPHLLYYGANVLFATKDGGRTWETISPDLGRKHPGIPPSIGNQAPLNTKGDQQRGAIYALAPSQHNVNTIWAGTDDGVVWLTRDAGKNWTDITPPALTPWSKVTQISASKYDDQTAYVSVSRMRIDDLRPYIYRTRDAGQTWQAITAGLPNSPVNMVREDPIRKGMLYAGTETAVWVSFDDGDHWQSLQLNLPHTSMRDLWIHQDDLIVGTHGRSIWVLDDIATLRQLKAGVPESEVHLFEPSPAVRVRRDTNTDTPLPADEPAGQNPPDGAIIDYYLAKPSSRPITLEILDSSGAVVRTFSSDDKPDRSPEESQKELIPLYWMRPFARLSTAAGMHRWVWDLRKTSPTSSEHEYPISAVPHDTPRYPLGPQVLPAKYVVRLTAEGKSVTSMLSVTMDPRVKLAPEALKQQFDLEQRLLPEISRSSETLWQARSIQEQLGQIAAKVPPSSDTIASLQKKITGVVEDQETSGSDQAKGLDSVNSDVISLYKELEKADAVPTSAEVKESTHILNRLNELLGRWSEIVRQDVPALNQQLPAGTPLLRLDKLPSQIEKGQDEE